MDELNVVAIGSKRRNEQENPVEGKLWVTHRMQLKR